MLVGILKFVFDVAIFLVGVATWVLVAYVLMQLLIPQNKYTLLVAKYVEPVLAPVRALLYRLFPGLQKLRVDLSPVGLWVILMVAEWVLRLVKGILL